jgi:SPP1 family predicted phage head-tail adaptor
MTLAAGRLRHRVSVQRRTPLLDSNGDVDQDPNTGEVAYQWMELFERWASIEPLSGREFIQSQATQSKVTGRILMRAEPALTPADRIVHTYNGKVYNLEAILPDKDSGLEYITILTSEGVNEEGA